MTCSLTVVIALTAVACGVAAERDPMVGGALAPPVTSTPASSQLISPWEFAAAVAEPGRLTINVHVPDEGNIEGTDLSIPFDQINVDVQALPADRNTPLAIYCRTGRMSAVAATTLSGLGYSHIVELDGGMQAWRTAGYILEPHRP